MCSTVVMPDGRWLDQVSDLVDAGFPLTADDVEEGRMDVCLCWVDVEAVLDRSGRSWSHDGSGFYVIAAVPVRKRD